MSSEGNEIRNAQNKIAKVLTNAAAHPIRVGPAGWSYSDWEGTVYPPHGSRFDALAYLASFFDTIEINSPFYRIPPPTHSRSWIRRVGTNPDFKFTTKNFPRLHPQKTQPPCRRLKSLSNYSRSP